VNDLPSISVRRPVLVLVLNLLIVLGGIAAIMAVETRELPDVDRPIVGVRAEYPGASPETMDAEVISIIEGAVARVSGIQNIASSSEENNGRMRIEFRPGVDLDSAASDVREAVNRQCGLGRSRSRQPRHESPARPAGAGRRRQGRQ